MNTITLKEILNTAIMRNLSWKNLLENKIKELDLSCTFNDLRIICENKNDLSVSFDKDESKIHIDFTAYVNLIYQQRYIFIPFFNINNRRLEIKSLSLYEIEKSY